MTDLTTFTRDLRGSESRALDGETWLFAFRLDRLRVGMRLASGSDGQWSMTETAFVATRGFAAPEEVRRVGLGSLLASARRTIAGSTSESLGASVLAQPSESDLAAFLAGQRGVRISDDDYARLALIYVLMVQEGNLRPAQTLSERHGHGSANQWSHRIAEARKRGLLTKVERGQTGGRLTRKAERLLGSTTSGSQTTTDTLDTDR